MKFNRKLNCERCGYSWYPRIEHPLKCPGCGSKIWDKPKTTNPMDVKEISIYGDEHSHYGYHYHIVPHPSFPPDQIMSLLLDELKIVLGINSFNKEEKLF